MRRRHRHPQFRDSQDSVRSESRSLGRDHYADIFQGYNCRVNCKRRTRESRSTVVSCTASRLFCRMKGRAACSAALDLPYVFNCYVDDCYLELTPVTFSTSTRSYSMVAVWDFTSRSALRSPMPFTVTRTFSLLVPTFLPVPLPGLLVPQQDHLSS